MTTKAKAKPRGKHRGPYRCAACREYGHRADKCPNKHKLQVILDSLPGDVALASLVPEYFQIVAVIEGQTGEALLGAIKGKERMLENGLPANDSLVNAYAELATRAAKIPSLVILRAREARSAYLAAEAAYAEACKPIHEALGHKPAKQLSSRTKSGRQPSD